MTAYLMIAKLEAYGPGSGSLNLRLPQFLETMNVGSAYSKRSKIRRGIPQGSILGPLSFNIFINDIFMIIELSDICNFPDDNTLYSRGKKVNRN